MGLAQRRQGSALFGNERKLSQAVGVIYSTMKEGRVYNEAFSYPNHHSINLPVHLFEAECQLYSYSSNNS